MEEKVSLARAAEIIGQTVVPLGAEPVELMLAAGRVLGEPASAWVDLPNADISGLDGFALRTQDTETAGQAPVKLKIIGESSFITPFEGGVSMGGCVRIYSGSVIPSGADAVVAVEDVTVSEEEIEVRAPIASGKGMRKKAEEFRMGEMMAEPGAPLTPGWISLLIAAGCAEVKAVKPPRVRLIAVGDELKNPGRALEPGDVFPSAAAGVFAWCRKLGASEVRLTLVGDDRYELQEEMPDHRSADLVITMGGTGHSERDVVLASLLEMEAEIKFRGISAKPGHFTSFALLGPLPVLCLPGGPSAAEMMFQLLGRPILQQLMGFTGYRLPEVKAVLAEPLPGDPGLDRLHRVRVEGGKAAPPKGKGLHRQQAESNGVVRVPAGSGFKAGDEAAVMMTE
jgi:molybdopterin molybdotransferase